jgi:hypothetical protein
MSGHYDSFPPLPTEIIISIVETAARQRETALNLCLVSKTIYNLIKPILYHSIQVKWYNFQRFHQWFFNFSPVDPHKRHRSLIRDLTIVCRTSYLFRIVDTCDKLERLVCSADIAESTRTESRPKELIICADNDTSTLYGGYIPPGVFTESVTHLYVNLPVLGQKFVETVEGMKCVKYVGASLITTRDPGAEEGVIDGMLGLLDIERLVGIFVYDRSTTITGVWKRLARVEDKRLVVAIQAVVDWEVDIVHAACSGVSPWEKMKGLEGWRKDIAGS